MICYISGAMTGMPNLNFPAFHAKAAELRAQGITVINPAEYGVQPGHEWSDYLRHDIRELMNCDAIYMLPGWQNSKGASLERYIASQLGMTILEPS